MNTGLFKQIILPAFQRNLPANINAFSDIFGNAYYMSTIGFSKTIYGATLLYADKSFLIQPTFGALTKNFIDSDFSKLSQNYKIMALGFFGYWTTAKFDLKVPPPLTAIPPQGTRVVIPGSLDLIALGLRIAFSQGDPQRSADALVAGLVNYHATISGVYTANTTTGTPIPAPLPWTGII